MYPFSPVKANVGRLCERLENAMKSGLGQHCGGNFANILSSADSEGPQRTGKCMYIKAWRNKRDFTGSTRPHCGRGREGPCFAVCVLVCDFSPKADGVPPFESESEREPFVREVKNQNEMVWARVCYGNF